MKQVKRSLALFLVLVITAAGLFGCNSDANKESDVAANNTAAADTKTADALYPKETIKIGLVTFDTSAEQFMSIQNYYKYLEKTFNIQMYYSETIDSAEGELAFIESCASAGCQAIIGYYNVARTESVQLAIDKGMYYFGAVEEDEVYEAFKDNDYYLGGYYYNNGEYQCGYDMAKGLIDAGCKKLIYVSGGRDFGVKMFIDRSEGFYAAVDDAVADGKSVEVVYDVSGWPGTDSYSADQTAALSTDADGVACSFGAATWLQPIANAGKSDSIKVAANDVLSEMYIEPFESGMMACLTVEMPGMFGVAIPMIVNAVDGNLDCIRDNGKAPRIPLEKWVITDAEVYNSYYTIETDGIWTFNAADWLTTVKGYNEEATYESLCELYNATSPEEITARREAQGE